jgi:hypothetical protein
MRVISPTKVETFDFPYAENGIGVPGLEMKIYIQRASSPVKWWNHATQDWDAAVVQNSMVALDATNSPGAYLYSGLPIAKMAAGDRYSIRYYCATAGYLLDISEEVGVEQQANDVASDSRLAYLDAAISSRAAPGAKMDFVDVPSATAIAHIQQDLLKLGTVLENTTVGYALQCAMAMFNGDFIVDPVAKTVTFLTRTGTTFSVVHVPDINTRTRVS